MSDTPHERLRVLGIDQSLTGTGLCVLEDGEILCTERVETDIADGYGRLVQIVDRIHRLLLLHTPQIVAMEKPAKMMRSGSGGILAELAGAIKVDIYRGGYTFGCDAQSAPYAPTFITFASSSMKRFCLGHGGTAKDTSYLLKVFQNVHQQFEDDDIADAYMHAMMASLVVPVLWGQIPFDSLPDHQQEALLDPARKKVKKGPKPSLKKAMAFSNELKRALIRLEA
jgi:Holliday junction resolvasome RuvABC endonuclease subunit